MSHGLIMLGALAIILLILFGDVGKATGACAMSYCKKEPTRTVTNTHRQISVDIYDPGHGKRRQIRDRHRRIIGYIESNGSITNINRQKKEKINERR
jgi:hypothetical protein